jgi:FtsP/CotA-like multicopper oxidase with cupredoxin domain
MNQHKDKTYTPDMTSGGSATLRRRGFLGWCAGAALPAVGASFGLTISACSTDDAALAQAQFTDLTTYNNPASITLTAQARKVQWLPGVNPTAANAWVYLANSAGGAADAVLNNHFGPVINVRRNSPCAVTWVNGLGPAAQRPDVLAVPPVNPPVGWEICGAVQIQSDVALVTHLHGARVPGSSDGWPLEPLGFAGNPYGFPVQRTYDYQNQQRSAMLWYHDHALDHTGKHVHAGLAGLYFIRDAADDAILNLVGGAAQELPVVIQDRIVAGSGIDYGAGMPTVDPLSRPEFLGTSIFVNGHPATVHALPRRTWRLRLLNASNARTYALALCNPAAIAARSGRVWHSDCMRIIGADGGLLAKSVTLGAADVLVLAPGQRRDVLVDFTQLPAGVSRLRLVNLNLLATLAINDLTPEAIYTTFGDSVLAPVSADYNAADDALYTALGGAVTDVGTITLEAAGASSTTLSPTAAAVDAVLAGTAADDDFDWNGQQLVAKTGIPQGPNRLVLLMSNTEGVATTDTVSTVSDWGDVQIFEMSGEGSDWQIPFAVDLASTVNPAAAGPSAPTGYKLARRSFFNSTTNPDITATKAYPALHAPTITCKGGTYERWYVSNLGNIQPQVANANLPDMHPFHIHLVSFVVTKRWDLDAQGAFVAAPLLAGDIDPVARQDTVLIPSNQMVELLVYIPPNYAGKFAYHCHLLEHEDMCMMSHFEVTA